MNSYFCAKSVNGTAKTKGLNSCTLGHKTVCPSSIKEDGVFAEWLWDGERLTVSNDRYGFYPLYYSYYNNEIRLSPSIGRLIKEGAPAELDYRALSVFIRLGFFIGEDTPFKYIGAVPPDVNFHWEKGNLTVTGRYALKDPVNISEDAGIDQFIDLFRQSMKRRLPSNDNFVVPLSGGRDSRHIILELNYLGYKPKAAVTLRPNSVFFDEDVQPARILSDALGINHILLDPENFKFNNEVRHFQLTHYCADEHSWFLPLADYLRETQVETSYDGIAGDVLSGRQTWKTKVTDLLRNESYPEFCKTLFKSCSKPTDDVLKLILDETFYDKVSLDCAVEHLTDEAEKHAHSADPLKSFKFWNRTRREISLSPYAINAGVPKVYSPFLDHKLYDFLMVLPEDITREGNFHTKAIERAYPKYSAIPYTQDNPALNRIKEHRINFTKNFAKYCIKNFVVSSQFLRARYFLPRMMKCLLNKEYCRSSWWMDPPSMLYLIELEKLVNGAS